MGKDFHHLQQMIQSISTAIPTELVYLSSDIFMRWGYFQKYRRKKFAYGGLQFFVCVRISKTQQNTLEQF